MENSTDNILKVETEKCNYFLKNYMSNLNLMAAECLKKLGQWQQKTGENLPPLVMTSPALAN